MDEKLPGKRADRVYLGLYSHLYSLVPGSILTLGAGAAFGLVTGTIAVSIGSVLGASAAFLLGRTLARGWIEKKVEGNVKFKAIDQALGDDAFRMILLIRLSPAFPFSLLNYMFGLTRAPFWKHFFASWIGMFPGTVMYVAIGAGIAGVFSEGGSAKKIMMFVGIVATVVVTGMITKMAKRALAKAVEETEPNESSLQEI